MKKRTVPSIALGLRGLAMLACAAAAALPASLPASHPSLAPQKDVKNAEKISGYLLNALTTSKAKGVAPAEVLAAYPFAKGDARGFPVEVILTEAGLDVSAVISATGAIVEADNSHLRRLVVIISDAKQLEAIAALPEVFRIKPLGQMRTANGSVDGLADEAHGANLFTGLPNDLTRGSGVRIGVLSDSFAKSDGVLDTDGSDGVTTVINNAGTELITRLNPGLYTIVINTPQAGASFDFEYSIAGVVTPDPACPITQITPLVATLTNTSGSQSRTTRAMPTSPDFAPPPPLGCSDSAAGFAFYILDVETTADIVLRAFPLANTGDEEEPVFPVYLGVREGCPTSDINVVCEDPNITGRLTNSFPQQSGDLPDQIFILADGPIGSSDEGAAMSELIYDTAPGSTQFFHTAFVGGPAGFAAGIRKLAGLRNEPGALTTPCDVIVDDIRYLYGSDPWYQPGIISQSVTAAVESGVTYFTAAGNTGDDAIRQVFSDINGSNDDTALFPTGNDLHRWPNGTGFLPVTLPPGGFFAIEMQWNQPWESYSTPNGSSTIGSEIDLNLFVTLTPNQAGLSEAMDVTAIQQGRAGVGSQGWTDAPLGDAFEVVQYRNVTNETQTVYVAVEHFDGMQTGIPQIAGEPLEFTMIFHDLSAGVLVQGINSGARIGGSAIYGHGINPEALVVGAVNYFDTPAFGIDNFETNEIDPEPFTSRGGGLTLYFDAEGLPNPVSTFKPDISAVDGNNTTFFPGTTDNDIGIGDFDLDGFPNFFGTSAAAPNAAAIAALMLDINRNLTPQQVRAVFEETAIDVKGARAAVGRDDVSGIGLVDAKAALDFVLETFGSDAGNATPAQFSFFFYDGDRTGWEFENPVSTYTSAGFGSSNGQLFLTATNNTDTFGSWKAPVFAVSGTEVPGFRTIDGKYGPGSLYRMTTRISASNADSAKTPNFRFRASSFNFEQTAELVISSNANGDLTPEAGAPRIYRHYFTLPTNQNRFRMFVDLLGFDPANENGATLSVNELVIQSLDEAQLINNRLERLILFNNGRTNGWTVRNPAPGSTWNQLNSASTSTGLALGPATSTNAFNFSYWGSPEATPVVTLERNKLYRAIFRISSSAPAGNKLDIPTFRVRMNESSLSMSSLLNIDPMSDSSNVPFEGSSVDYRLFFEAPESITGSNVFLSFDQMFIPGYENNPNVALRLESVRVDSFSLPPL